VFPAFVGTMKPEVTFVGFPIERRELGPEWYFAVQEQVGETRFSYDLTQGARTAAQSVYMAVNDRLLGATPAATAAVTAAALVHVPTRLLVPVAHYLVAPAEVVEARGEVAT